MRIPVIHKKAPAPAGARYVGRPSLLGNPFKMKEEGDRADEVLEEEGGHLLAITYGFASPGAIT